MTMSFKDLKKSRSSAFDKLNSQLKNMDGGRTVDDRYWKPEVDKAGNGFAVIRFLPAPAGEDASWVRIWDHGFKGPGGWYIENSLTTLGQDDPVSEFNSKLWNATEDDNSPQRKQARDQKRRLSYYSNILVVKDPANPSNEGKVFLFKYGKKIFDKIKDVMHPSFQDEKPVNPFDLWEGADFKLKIRQVEGYRNYDKSEFDSPSVVSVGGETYNDDKLEALWKSEYSLVELVDPKHFKSYDELATKLYKVLGLAGGAGVSTKTTEVDEDDQEDYKPAHKTAEAKPAPAVSYDGDDDDDTLDFFKNLANE